MLLMGLLLIVNGNDNDNIMRKFQWHSTKNIGPKLASKIQHRGKNYFDYLIKPAQTCTYKVPIVSKEIVTIIVKFNSDNITNDTMILQTWLLKSSH